MYIRLFFIFLFLFTGCSVKQLTVKENSIKVERLKRLIENLSPTVNSKEALDVARNSVAYSFELSKKYEAVSFPWLQNTLVNMGIKKRGLCYEWTEDLLKYLVKRGYKTIRFHAIGANIGYLNEHNALSISSAKSEIFNSIGSSILLDAWRNSGNLYFSRVNEDKKYEWSERFNLYGVLPHKSGKE